MNSDAMLDELIELSRSLGAPEADLAILGEGNTSARCDAESFWVKASGSQLRDIGPEGFTQVRFAPILKFLERGQASDDEVSACLAACCVEPDARRPSVETFMHAVCLTDGEANWVGHTHPSVWNAILCSIRAEEAIAGQLFPDAIVVCGPAPVYVPYVDPGLPLALAVRDALRAYRQRWGRPRVILLRNHGLVALGRSANEVLSVTQMAVKWARILLGAYALGGPTFLTAEHADRIHSRQDEHYRQRQLKLEDSA